MINPIYSLYVFYGSIIASMSALWFMFDVMGL